MRRRIHFARLISILMFMFTISLQGFLPAAAQFGSDCYFEYGTTAHVSGVGIGGGSCYFEGEEGDIITVTLTCLILDNCGYLRLFTPSGDTYDSLDGYTFTGLELPESGTYTLNFGYDFGSTEEYVVDEFGSSGYANVGQSGEIALLLQLAESGSTGERFDTARIVNHAEPDGTVNICNEADPVHVQIQINQLHILDAQEADSEFIGGTEKPWLTYGIGMGPDQFSLEFGNGDVYYSQWSAEIRPDAILTEFAPMSRPVDCGETAYIFIATYEEDSSLMGGTTYERVGVPWVLPIEIEPSGIDTYPANMELSFSGLTSYGTYDYRVTYTVTLSDQEAPKAALPGSLATTNMQVIYWALDWPNNDVNQMYWLEGGLQGEANPIFEGEQGVREYPDLSPDGTQFTYVSDAGGTVVDGETTIDIFVSNLDGSEVTRLTDLGGRALAPRWSPDGEHIVFIYTEIGDDIDNEIYVINVDGSNLQQLTDTTESESFPSWSPDGTQIVYSTGTSDGYVIKTMNGDGSNVQQLTELVQHINDFEPVWSPDGSKIAFTSNRDVYDAHNIFEIYVMDADGSNQTRLTVDLANDRRPIWSPDGSQIAYSSWVQGQPGKIVVMNVDGTNPVTILSNSVQNIQWIEWVALP